MTSAHYKSVCHILGFDIGCYLGVGRATEGTHRHDDDDQQDDGDDDDVGGCRYTPLQCYGMIRGGILGKEGMEETCWRVGDIEEDGRMKIGTLAACDDNDGHAFLGFKG
ncbi:hypothetical protein ARMGADRAFT_1089029 [Armillaria gallica]|uniref:Uncharacterized protein n=1 Tax=Armillaria gallica TaxID=47427 RepID=A0A2H3D655_ARMGA|nr:hypothetical protein ARMGADRAFT_1089029 [Armillaria gallica]